MSAQPPDPRLAIAAQWAARMLLALLLWCAGVSSALAAATITAVTINGQNTANVVPGATISVSLYVTLTGSTRWRYTQLDTSPASSLARCIDNQDDTGPGDYILTFNAVAPDTGGVFSLLFAVHPNPNCSSGPVATRTFGNVLETDGTFPSVVSIVRNLPSPTSASPVTWTVTFDRPVSGVTLGDFGLVASGVGGTTLSGVVDSSSVYTLQTPNTGSGTLGLNVIDDDSIVGDNGRPLGGVGTGNGNFTGQVYVIDRTAPTIPTAGISSNNALSTLYARVGNTISVAFTTSDASGVQTPTATINGVAATVTGSGSSWVASRAVVAGDAEGVVTFTLDVKDVLGNTAVTRTTVTNATTVTIDKTAPVATISCSAACGTGNPVAAGQVSWSVAFSEAVTGLSTANFSFSGSGAAGASIVSVSGGPGTYTVVANVTTAGVVGLNLSANLSSVLDRAGNSPAASTAVAGNSYTVAGCTVASGGACTLDAVESGGAIGSPIFTKRVGAAVTLDILALNGAALNANSTDPVQATLVVASGSGCAGAVVSDTVSFSFAPANGGRRSATFVPSRAASEVRVRLVSGAVTLCSNDNFALRPDSLSVSTSNATADAAGASATAATVFKAGSGAFALQASSSVGYSGTPKLAQARLLASGAALGSIAGVFGAADAVSGSASGAAFTYSEVGYVRLDTWGAYDDGSFAAVDSIKGECFTDAKLGTANAPLDPNTLTSGKYGCYFGSGQSAWFGRFIPDHFALSAGAIVNRSATAACAASPFTYMGETLTASFVLTAQNFQNVTTANYTGTFARLNIPTQLGAGAIDDPAAGVRRPLAACAAPAVGPCLARGAASGSFLNGASGAITLPLSVARGTTAVAPYTAFKLGVMPIDSDGVRIGAYNLDTVNVVAGVNQRALVASSALRYGRLQIDNAYGSELLNLSVKVAAQYWNGSAWVANTQDSCTPLGASGFTVAGQSGGITALNMNASHLVAGTAMASGAGKVVLTKPTPAPTVKGRALLQSGNGYLPGTGRVTFGVYKAGPVIYVRETY